MRITLRNVFRCDKIDGLYGTYLLIAPTRTHKIKNHSQKLLGVAQVAGN